MATRVETALAPEAALGESLEAAQEIARLQMDIKQANAFATAHSEENKKLKLALQEKNAFIQAQSRSHSHFRQTWKREQELFQDEKRAFSCEQETWTRRLENIKKDVASLEHKRATLGPRDDSATSNLLKEMQEEHTNRCESLKAERESWQQRYFECKKKQDGIQAENNAMKDKASREKETAEAYRVEISKLQHSLVRKVEESVKDKNGKLSSESVLRDLRQQYTQKELMVERLVAEAKILREARDQAVRAKDEMYAASRSEQGILNEEKLLLEKKCQTLEVSLAIANKNADDQRSIREKAEEELKISKRELGELHETLSSRDSLYLKGTEDLRKEMADNEVLLKSRLTECEKMLLEEQGHVKKLQAQFIDSHNRALDKIKDLEEDINRDDIDAMERQLVEAREHLLRSESTISGLRDEIKVAKSDHRNEVERFEFALVGQTKDLDLVRIEKKDLERHITTLYQKANSLQTSLEKAETALGRAQEENMGNRVAAGHLQERVTALLAEMSSLKSQLGKEREAVETLKMQVGRERKRGGLYKEKALEAQKKSLEAKSLLEELCKKSSG